MKNKDTKLLEEAYDSIINTFAFINEKKYPEDIKERIKRWGEIWDIDETYVEDPDFYADYSHHRSLKDVVQKIIDERDAIAAHAKEHGYFDDLMGSVAEDRWALAKQRGEPEPATGYDPMERSPWKTTTPKGRKRHRMTKDEIGLAKAWAKGNTRHFKDTETRPLPGQLP